MENIMSLKNIPSFSLTQAITLFKSELENQHSKMARTKLVKNLNTQ